MENIEALILKIDLLCHHIRLSIPTILNLQTMSNKRVTNTTSNQHCGQPIEARDNVQEFLIHWPFLKLNKEKTNFISFCRLMNAHRLLCAMN